MHFEIIVLKRISKFIALHPAEDRTTRPIWSCAEYDWLSRAKIINIGLSSIVRENFLDVFVVIAESRNCTKVSMKVAD